MKKIIILLAILCAAVSCSFFELDSFEAPNAQVTGRLFDMVTGEQISLEAGADQSFSWATWSYVTAVKYGSLVVMEQDYVPPTWAGDPADYPKTESEQDWLVRFDGTFTNTMVFAAKYRFSTKKLPCYEPESGKNMFTLEKGRNTMDIGVLPFCRIKDPKIVYNPATKKVVATFYVELGDPSRANKVSNVSLCANTQLFVGCNNLNLAKNDKGSKAQNVQPGELITLEIDTDVERTPANADLFKYSTQDRYFRIAAMAEGNGYNQSSDKFYNFSPIYKVKADFSAIEEVQWDEIKWE